jgi:heme oxygenase
MMVHVMTKAQAKRKLERIKELIEDLRIEVEETVESIEPYEGKDDLTEAQQERLEWFEELQQALEDFEYECDCKLE